MRVIRNLIIVILMSISCFQVKAGGQYIEGLTIQKLRAVGNHHNANTFDDTLEVWFSSSLTWSDAVPCESTFRVYIDASKTHMVGAAYLAFATGKKVNIYADDTLPVRHGSCEVSYIDVNH